MMERLLLISFISGLIIGFFAGITAGTIDVFLSWFMTTWALSSTMFMVTYMLLSLFNIKLEDESEEA